MGWEDIPKADREYQSEWYALFEKVHLIETDLDLQWEVVAVAFARNNPDHPSTEGIKQWFGIK